MSEAIIKFEHPAVVLTHRLSGFKVIELCCIFCVFITLFSKLRLGKENILAVLVIFYYLVSASLTSPPALSSGGFCSFCDGPVVGGGILETSWESSCIALSRVVLS